MSTNNKKIHFSPQKLKFRKDDQLFLKHSNLVELMDSYFYHEEWQEKGKIIENLDKLENI